MTGRGLKTVGMDNIDPKTVEGFGDEWHRFDQTKLRDDELQTLFERYFGIFPWDKLPAEATGFDMGCGSGRWARLVAERVGILHCIDAAPEALNIARRNLQGKSNCRFHLAAVDALPLADDSMDFGYSLGVLHHVPDTLAGLKSCVLKLKPAAPFLVYLYYAFDNRPLWFRGLWRVSDFFRRVISKLPFGLRSFVSNILAASIYYPLARSALLAEHCGLNVERIPLSGYRRLSFYSMRTDALDRFGTRLEQRFTAAEIRDMMHRAGLDKITISDKIPYWCAVGFKSSP